MLPHTADVTQPSKETSAEKQSQRRPRAQQGTGHIMEQPDPMTNSSVISATKRIFGGQLDLGKGRALAWLAALT